MNFFILSFIQTRTFDKFNFFIKPNIYLVSQLLFLTLYKFLLLFSSNKKEVSKNIASLYEQLTKHRQMMPLKESYYIHI